MTLASCAILPTASWSCARAGLSRAAAATRSGNGLLIPTRGGCLPRCHGHSRRLPVCRLRDLKRCTEPGSRCPRCVVPLKDNFRTVPLRQPPMGAAERGAWQPWRSGFLPLGTASARALPARPTQHASGNRALPVWQRRQVL
ncbi:protein of unknown function [Cupriavidus neocaledonicus]|uniref:Uncharacterized protein n=1 Tax=Cupriavidus neocaledonicus TaxID=1040979 RepID=A0A375H9E5_9BURK|nr:exported hypothetical protein [Cupriavidus neocaledonicus]SPD46810.1 protein of unknown function [Cupriavidus neocaledonicus]